MLETIAVPEGSDARLPCVSVGNPTTDFTNWTRHGESVRSKPRFEVLEKGSLLIQNVRRTDAGEYACTPYNKVGAGMPKTIKLALKGRYLTMNLGEGSGCQSPPRAPPEPPQSPPPPPTSVIFSLRVDEGSNSCYRWFGLRLSYLLGDSQVTLFQLQHFSFVLQER